MEELERRGGKERGEENRRGRGRVGKGDEKIIFSKIKKKKERKQVAGGNVFRVKALGLS